MKLLITGGSGFLGANTARFFSSNKNFKVTVVTRKNKNKFFNKISDCNFIKINWNSDNDIKKKISNFDLIIHYAGLNAQDCEKDIVTAREFNLFLTEKIFKYAIKSSVKKFIFISSAHIYGDSLKKRVDENTIPLPISNYGLIKLITEEKLLNLYRNSKKNTNLLILRVSNVFGSPVLVDTNVWQLVFLDFAKQAIKSNQIKINGNPYIRRNFLPMRQYLEMLEYIITKKKKFKNINILNIGSNWSPTIDEVAKRIQYRFDRKYLKKIKIVKNKKNLQKYKNIEYLSNSILLKKNEKEDIHINSEIDNLLNYCKEMTNIL